MKTITFNKLFAAALMAMVLSTVSCGDKQSNETLADGDTVPASTEIEQTGLLQFRLKGLPYPYDALEPYIDSKTMNIHYHNHHGAFSGNLNRILGNHPEWQDKDAVFLCKNLDLLPAEIQTAVRNNAGGFFNHDLFWEVLAPAGTAPISARMENVINENFGSFEAFQAEFEQSAASRFGSGWVWLMKDTAGKLYIVSTPNQDNPLMDTAARNDTPILGLDVWEHAYYLKYQYRRAAYISAFWNVVNWNKVEELYFGEE